MFGSSPGVAAGLVRTTAKEAPTEPYVSGSLRALLVRSTTVPFLFALCLPAAVHGATTYEEHVLFLGHAAHDNGRAPQPLLVRRDDGDSFLLTVGDGCGRLSEGRRIALREELENGRRLAYVEDLRGDSTCHVIGSKAVTLVDDGPEAPTAPSDGPADLAPVVRALQGALEILGYEPGPVDGEVGPETAAALMQYRSDKRHDRGGLDLRFTIWTLGMDVLVMRPRDEGAFVIADTLFRLTDN